MFQHKSGIELLPSKVMANIEKRVAICIEVLKAYATGELITDQCDELDAAIEAAYEHYLAENAYKWQDHDWHDNPLDH